MEKQLYIQLAWRKTITGQEFMNSLSEAGYVIAKGERSKYVLVDRRTNEIDNLFVHLPRDVTAGELEDRLGKYHKRLRYYREVLQIERNFEKEQEAEWERQSQECLEIQSKMMVEMQKMINEHGEQIKETSGEFSRLEYRFNKAQKKQAQISARLRKKYLLEQKIKEIQRNNGRGDRSR